MLHTKYILLAGFDLALVESTICLFIFIVGMCLYYLKLVWQYWLWCCAVILR